MTYKSLTIEEHSDQQSATAAYRNNGDYKRFASLNAFTWPGSAWSFAQDNNLAVDYVDNCWLRVAVNAQGLREFLGIGGGNHPEAFGALEKVCDGYWYVINEEEF